MKVIVFLVFFVGLSFLLGDGIHAQIRPTTGPGPTTSTPKKDDGVQTGQSRGSSNSRIRTTRPRTNIRKKRSSYSNKVLLSEIEESLVVKRKNVKKYRKLLPNREYFMFKLRKKADCSKVSEKRQDLCKIRNREIEKRADSFTFLGLRHASRPGGELTYLSEAEGKESKRDITGEILTGFSERARTYILPLESEDLLNVGFGQKELQELVGLSRSGSKEPVVADRKSQAGEAFRSAPLVLKKVYAVRVIHFDKSSQGLARRDVIYLLKPVAKDKKGVVTFVGRVLWNWVRPLENFPKNRINDVTSR